MEGEDEGSHDWGGGGKQGGNVQGGWSNWRLDDLKWSLATLFEPRTTERGPTLSKQDGFAIGGLNLNQRRSSSSHLRPDSP